MLNEEQIVQLLHKYNLKATSKRVDAIKRILYDENKIIDNNSVCVPFYDSDGRIYIYRYTSNAYQYWALRLLQKMIKAGVLTVKQMQNPVTKRMKKYLCLNLQ
ncbi:hypothetical protein SBRV1_gp52 [Sulfolobales Beppu rod-shaped virus 1]|uniref:Uncharacterized protein n=1 Tax=Sulfolobales Beppu rod-shaped virus 1 TaxID=2493121 RepID=A0A3Q8Q419_9VIRU|nr:hypothetical protein QIT32_gp52 [Sulfolobales Beppu rod-shaped virus 1]AZI75941.1 hypothetical protein SBRV1_gp52 [Sulfolobales Beppu rod-shaped virus 1]